jgi:hypothetical protein
MLTLWIPRGDRQPAPPRPQTRTDLNPLARKVPLAQTDSRSADAIHIFNPVRETGRTRDKHV